MTITIEGAGLSLADIDAVSRGESVRLTQEAEVLSRIERSRAILRERVSSGEPIYGVTTLFGGLAARHVKSEHMNELQRVALWHFKAASGPRLATADVRGAMLLRANSLAKGASGIRLEIIERLVAFLNAGLHPVVYQRGSIGASGDLMPLAYIGGSVLGLDRSYQVEYRGQLIDSHAALKIIAAGPLTPEIKEGLALINGTGASTAVAANALYRAAHLIAVAFGVHALVAQALLATTQSFEPAIHALKPHPGQVWSAQQLARLLEGSKIVRMEASGQRGQRIGELVQDRYSLRCLPQYLGPIVDGLRVAIGQIEVEANCANDNPLIDVDNGEILHTGNFLAQYTGVAMDSVRYLIGLLTKHLDVQIALLMMPEFSNGLPSCLIGNPDVPVNLGLKSLQVCGNSLMPLIQHYGQSIVDRFPTHAEQFNQNVNSQSMNSANLAREQLDVLEHYLAVALLCAVQAVELRSKVVANSYDARAVLSPATQPLYLAVRSAASGAPDAARPMHFNDLDGMIQPKIEGILADIAARGEVSRAVQQVCDGLMRTQA